MRRLGVIIALLLLVLSLAGCGDGRTAESEPENGVAASAETTTVAEARTADLAEQGYHVPIVVPLPGETPYDDAGIRRWDYGKDLGLQYLPLEICNDALQFHDAYHEVPKGKLRYDAYEDEFFHACEWLLENSEDWGDDGLLLLNRHDLSRFGVTTPGPWPSALTQGRAARIMAMAFEWSGDELYADAARKLLRPVMADLDDGGLTYAEGSEYWFEEYPLPQPDHVLNGHQSVILDMLQVADLLGDESIRAWAMRGSESLVRALPDFELEDRMAWALSYEIGSTLADPRPVENNALNYDRIHLLYLQKLHSATGDQAYATYFWRYYAAVALRDTFHDVYNVVSPKRGAVIRTSSKFFTTEGHKLQDAFGNFHYLPSVYASAEGRALPGATTEFTVDLGRECTLNGIDLRFHAEYYPQDFKLEGLTTTGWVELVSEEDWEPTDARSNYRAELGPSEPVTSVRFTASKFQGGRALLLDYFSMTEAFDKSAYLDDWRALAAEPSLAYLDINSVAKRIESDSSLTSLEEVNNALISAMANRLMGSGADIEFAVDVALRSLRAKSGRFSMTDPATGLMIK